MHKRVINLVFVCLMFSCKTNHKDYSFLLNLAGNNRTEIKKIIDHYNAQNDQDNMKMAEFFLESLPNQYQLKYSLITDKENISLEGLSPDSIDVLRLDPNSSIKIDTIWDIKLVNSNFITTQINRAISLRKQYKWFGQIPINTYCKYILPLWLNNEERVDYKKFYEKRYLTDINEVLMKDLDTVDMLKTYLDPFFLNSLYPARKHVDFSSSPQFNKIADGCDSCLDNEDIAILNIQALRTIGIPSTYEYIPFTKDITGGLITINIIGKDGKSHFISKDKWPYKLKIAKCYRNISNPKNLINPFFEILNQGENVRNIPFDLNLPRMEDVTQERTISYDIKMNVVDSLLKFKTLYISLNDGNKWRIIFYGKIDHQHKRVTFKNMGAELVYNLATNNNGIIKLIGRPFILDSLGRSTELSSAQGLSTLKLTHIDQKNTIIPGKSYSISFWDTNKNNWNKMPFKKAISDTLNITNVPAHTIYKVIELDIKAERNYLFTYNSGKQDWR